MSAFLRRCRPTISVYLRPDYPLLTPCRGLFPRVAFSYHRLGCKRCTHRRSSIDLHLVVFTTVFRTIPSGKWPRSCKYTRYRRMECHPLLRLCTKSIYRDPRRTLPCWRRRQFVYYVGALYTTSLPRSTRTRHRRVKFCTTSISIRCTSHLRFPCAFVCPRQERRDLYSYSRRAR